jgi:SAM-dependent methyltransferase
MQRPRFIARQASRPSGILGWLLGRIMARETARENIRTLQLLDIQPTDHVLELGFGHGRTVARAAALAYQGQVAGVEVSARMVEMAKTHNAVGVREGRVKLQQTSGLQLPYADQSFDKVYSVHTIYFWANAEAQLDEVRRALRPNGCFVLTFRYGERFVTDLPPPIYRHRSPDEVVSLLRRARFEPIDAREDPPLYFIQAGRRI